jgi:hypothetical protein
LTEKIQELDSEDEQAGEDKALAASSCINAMKHIITAVVKDKKLIA